MGGHRLWQMRKVGQQRARIVRRGGDGPCGASCSFQLHNRDGPRPAMHPEISKLRNLPFASVYSFLLERARSSVSFNFPLVNAGLMNERIKGAQQTSTIKMRRGCCEARLAGFDRSRSDTYTGDRMEGIILYVSAFLKIRKLISKRRGEVKKEIQVYRRIRGPDDRTISFETVPVLSNMPAAD